MIYRRPGRRVFTYGGVMAYDIFNQYETAARRPAGRRKARNIS